MLADAVMEELTEIRSESQKWLEDRNACMSAMAELQDSVHEKFGEIDELRLEIRRFKEDMEHWKLGAADVLADAREEVLTANFQPLEKKIEDMNTVLSGVVKTSSNAQLATINVESRLAAHLTQYEQDRNQDRSHHKETFESVRSLVDATEADAAHASEALARDIAHLNDDIKSLQTMQHTLAHKTYQVHQLTVLCFQA